MCSKYSCLLCNYTAYLTGQVPPIGNNWSLAASFDANVADCSLVSMSITLKGDFAINCTSVILCSVDSNTETKALWKFNYHHITLVKTKWKLSICRNEIGFIFFSSCRHQNHANFSKEMCLIVYIFCNFESGSRLHFCILFANGYFFFLNRTL